MQHKISIVSKNTWSSTFLEKQLKDLFGGLFQISCHSHDTNPVVPVYSADLILLHEPSVLIEMQPFIHCDCPVLLMSRTVTMDALQKLKKIPEGVSIVVVNLTDYMARETMINIYQLGFKRNRLYPWAPDSNMDFPDTDYIVTHRIYDFLPQTSKPTVILGSRVPTTELVMDILTYFNVESEVINEIIKKYTEIIPVYFKSINYLLDNNRFLSAQWNLLFNKINIGVAVISAKNKILSHNTIFKEMLWPQREVPDSFEKLSNQYQQLKIAEKKVEYKDELVEIMGNKFALNISFLESDTPSLGRILTLEPYEQIQSVQQKMHKKIVGDSYSAKYSFSSIIGKNPKIRQSIELGKRFSKSKFPVLIYGESGTGKELMASAIHNYAFSSKRPYIAVNCAGIPDSLIESEFFGYEGSAFTGAKKAGSVGLFEKADGGTLFLDEVSEIPYSLQAKLLRVIQEQEVRKVGSNQVILVNVRIIAASNKKLYDMVEKGEFRPDLYHRLNVFSLSLPPLKERRSDIFLLCSHFLKQKKRNATEAFYNFIKSYDWPGNVRELANVIEYMCVACDGDLDITGLPDYITERNVIKKTQMNISTKKKQQLLLEAIIACQRQGSGTGRRSIRNYIIKNYFQISEMEIRNKLKMMRKNGYIIIHKGRKGTQITEKGYEILKAERIHPKIA